MILVIIFLTAYCVLLIALHIGWHRAVHDRENTGVAYYPMISVVVPIRNEEQSIKPLLDDLRQQEYGNYEVILVNDHSTDQTLAVAQQNKFPNVTILQNLESGKKAALRTGIEISKGEIIATTDADCILGKYWLESIRKTLISSKTKFVFGAVAIKTDQSFFSRVQAVEFASLIGSGAATSALGFPTMSNGANLAFRKESFIEVGGYAGNEHIPSGDDEFLMRKILKRFPGSVKFVPHKDAAVLTMPQQSFIEFVQQRLRWAGKWKYNSSLPTLLLAFFIFGIQLAILAAIVLTITTVNYTLLILLIAKLILEGIFISRVCRFSGAKMSWFAFGALQFLYPLYVITIGLFSNFVTPTWKGRRVPGG